MGSTSPAVKVSRHYYLLICLGLGSQPLRVEIKCEDCCEFFDLKWADSCNRALQQPMRVSLIPGFCFPLGSVRIVSRPSIQATPPKYAGHLTVENSAAGLPIGKTPTQSKPVSWLGLRQPEF